MTKTAFMREHKLQDKSKSQPGPTKRRGRPPKSAQTTGVSASTSVGSVESFPEQGWGIYNSSQSDKAVAAIAFGSDKTVTSGTFTIQFPTADADNAIIRIA